MSEATETEYYKRDFWVEENTKYSEPHHRMRKVARLANRLSGSKSSRLLDVGCGPATLQGLLEPHIAYFGIDIAIHEPAPNLKESDILEEPINFDNRPFDIVVAQGLFEYLGDRQSRKFREIADVVSDTGSIIITYVNFDHRRPNLYWPYSNVQSPAKFRSSLAETFVVERQFATAHNWNHTEPTRRLICAPNMYLNVRVPYLTSRLAVEYVYVCRRRV